MAGPVCGGGVSSHRNGGSVMAADTKCLRRLNTPTEHCYLPFGHSGTCLPLPVPWPRAEFIFETATQEELSARLRQAERNRHALHTQPMQLCPLCPPVRCTTCHSNGGWQQPDGLIVECPRGCMTDDDDPEECTGCGSGDRTLHSGLCRDCSHEADYVGGLAPHTIGQDS